MRTPLRLAAPAFAALTLFVGSFGCGSSGRDMRVPVEGAVSPTRPTSTTSTTATTLPVKQFSLTSPNFDSGEPIPVDFSCTGPAPALSWTGVPAGIVELILIVVEPSTNNFLWVVTGIAPTNGFINKGALPSGATPLNNSSGKAVWLGPCPPKDGIHTYNFMLFASPEAIVTTPNMAPQDVLTKAQNAAQGQLVILSGTFTTAGSPPGSGSAGSSAPATGTGRGTSSTKLR